jgi:hypothetical protein
LIRHLTPRPLGSPMPIPAPSPFVVNWPLMHEGRIDQRGKRMRGHK